MRFGAHLAAVAVLIAVHPAPAPWWALAAVGFLMVWLVNLYNFMDGADGLAGGMALFGFGGYALAALSGPVPQLDLGLASAAVAGAAAGFLLFNFHPARIFLGDAGSIPLGFLAGALGYWGWLRGHVAHLVSRNGLRAVHRRCFGHVAAAARCAARNSGTRIASTTISAWCVRASGTPQPPATWYVVMAAGIMLAILGAWAFLRLFNSGVAAWMGVVSVCGGGGVDLRWRRFQSTLSEQSLRYDADVKKQSHVAVRSALSLSICARSPAAWLAAYIIRFNGSVPADFWPAPCIRALWVLPVYGVMFRIFGLYRGMWVFASLPDLMRISKAVVAGALVVMVGLGDGRSRVPIVPRSVLVVSPLLLFLAMGGSRALYRATKEFYLYGGLVGQGKPVVVLGAGNAGASLARELSRSSEWRLVGLLDDDPAKHGREIYGYKVLGSISELPQLGRDAQDRIRDHRDSFGFGGSAAPRGDAVRARRRAGHGAAGADRADARSGVPLAGAPDRPGRPAGPRAGQDRHAARRSPAARSRGDGDGRGRLDRFGTVPPDPALSSRRNWSRSICPSSRCTGSRKNCTTAFRSLPVVPVIGDAKDSLLLDQVHVALCAAHRVPRGGLQARAADGGAQRLAGGAQQHAGHLPRRARGDPPRGASASC